MDASGDHEAQRTAHRLVLRRAFEASRRVVFKAWTDPAQVVRWWGPRGFATTIETMDLRLGGVWEHVMHGPDGTDDTNRSVFREVVKPERVACAHGGGKRGTRGVGFEATWAFDAVGRQQTKLTMCLLSLSAGAREHAVEEYDAIEGSLQTLERLAEHLGAKA